MNNHVFQRLLATFDLSRHPDVAIEVFKLGGIDATRSKIRSWREKNTQSKHYRPMPDDVLDAFFDGLQEACKRDLIQIYLNYGNSYNIM